MCVKLLKKNLRVKRIWANSGEKKITKSFLQNQKKSEINIFKTKNTIDDGWEDISEVDIFFQMKGGPLGS